MATSRKVILLIKKYWSMNVTLVCIFWHGFFLYLIGNAIGNLFNSFKIHKMETSKDVNKETIGILNDLIQIHNDRMEGYEKAARELQQDNADLRELFNMMITESRKMKSTLI